MIIFMKKITQIHIITFSSHRSNQTQNSNNSTTGCFFSQKIEEKKSEKFNLKETIYSNERLTSYKYSKNF